MAFRKACRQPFLMCRNGSLVGELSEPCSTECSRMCGTPVSSDGGVRGVGRGGEGAVEDEECEGEEGDGEEDEASEAPESGGGVGPVGVQGVVISVDGG